MIRICTILVVISLYLFGCSSQTSQAKLSKVKENINIDENQIIEKDTTITCACNDGLHSVKVFSKYIDLSPDSNFVLNQYLIFIKDGVNLTTIELPFDYTVVEILNSKIRVYKSVLLEAKCITSKSGKNIYSFYGAHAFDPQHEFFSYNDENGKWLWYFYGDRYETFKKIGDESNYKKEFGNELSSLNNMTEVFPNYK